MLGPRTKSSAARTAPLDSLRQIPAAASIGVGAVLAALLFVLGPSTYTLSAANDVHWRPPGPRVDPLPYAAAKKLAQLAPEGRVLAPMQVCAWVPTVHNHPAPMMVKLNHLRTLKLHLGEEETNKRVALTRLVSGFDDARPAAPYLAGALADLDAVCIVRRAEAWPEVARALQEAGFVRSETDGRYAFWTRG